MTKPNILFVFTDDQRFDTIGALGNEAIKTPNLDRLVARGTTFTQAHIPCGSSPAVCMPSRAMLYTGRTLFHLDGCGERIPEEHVTLGEALGRAGYTTFGTGKWHNGTDSFNRSFSTGDEIYFGGMMDHWNMPAFTYDPSGAYASVIPKCVDPFNSREVELRPADHIHAGRHSSEIVCSAGVDFIEQYNDEAPFFAYISFLAPHDPRVMPDEYRAMYDPSDIELPPNYMGGHPFDTGALHIRDEELAGFPRDPEEVKSHIAEYYAMITHLDAELGRVLDALERKGILDDTLIVFAGDNGLAVGQHGLMGKQNCYEHSVRVPLIFAGPGIPAGKQTDAYVYLLDIFPTLCELTGTERPESVEGESLVPAITGDARIRDTLYFAYIDAQRAVKDRRYKLIEYAVENRERQTQLFDHVNDPWELDNLARKPEHSETLQALQAEMLRYREAWDDDDSVWGQSFWARHDALI